MAYKVTVDDYTIYDPVNNNDPFHMLEKGTLTTEINQNGSFAFTMVYEPEGHGVFLRKSAIKVFDGNELIFIGRAYTRTRNLYHQIDIESEGPFAFLGDTIQPAKEYDPTTVSGFLTDVLNIHNQQIANSSDGGISGLPFRVGTVTVNPSKSIYRKTNWESTKDVLNRMLLDAEGGYFLFEYRGSYFEVNYVDENYLRNHNRSNQTISLGSNLIDFNREQDFTGVVSAVIPVGNNDLTCAQANNGSIYITDPQLLKDFGWSCVTKSFSDIGPSKLSEYTGGDDEEARQKYEEEKRKHAEEEAKGAAELVQKGREYLRSQQYNRITIDVTAADLHYENPTFTPFNLGQSIHVLSAPHGVDQWLPLTKMDININSAEKKITLGTIKHKDLTEITKPKEQEKTKEQTSKVEATQAKSLTEDDVNKLIDKKIKKAARVPVSLFYAKMPKVKYKLGEHINYSSAVVKLSYSDGTVEDVTSRVSWVPSSQFTVAAGFEASPGIIAIYRFDKTTGGQLAATVTAWPDGKLLPSGNPNSQDLYACAPVDIDNVEVVPALPANPNPKIIYYVTGKAASTGGTKKK